jgi:NAD kinase
LNNYQASIGVILAALIIVTAIAIPCSSSILNQSSYAFIDENATPRGEKAPVVVSGGGNNIYVVWSSDKNTVNKNGELMFRVSNDGGKRFSNKINLSNSTNADAIDLMISVDGDTIAVTWWEHNQTANVPVMRISTDNGQTFSPILNLAANGTIGTGTAA